MILIYQHLGLGDHLICNGLIREICKNKQETFLLAVKTWNYESISFMYKDVENIKTISVIGDQCILETAKKNNCKILIIGHQFLNYNQNFDFSFYDQFKLDFEKRWTSFYVQRDSNREKLLYEKFNLTSDYIFVHDDAERNMEIDKKFFRNEKIIKSDRKLTNNIFDYLFILENAKEIHCIESSFLFLVDSFNFKGKLFNHRYAREYPQNNTPTLKNKWNIITKIDYESSDSQ